MQEVNAASVSALSKADFQHLVPRSWSDIQIHCCNLTENTSEEHKENLGDRQVPQFTSPFPGCVSVGGAQHRQVEIGSISMVVFPILVQEDCKPFQLEKDSEIAVLLSVPVKFGGREVQLGWHWRFLVRCYLCV